MAIEFDAAASATAVGDSVLFNATVAEADSIMLFFNSNTVGYNLYNAATIRYPTGVTDATFLRQLSTGNRSIGCWYLLNPATGTNQVEMAFSSNFDKCGAVLVLKKQRPTGQPDSSAQASSTTGAVGTLTTTVVDANSWTVGAWVGVAGATPSAGTTQRIDQIDSGTGSHLYLGDSNGPVASGSQSLEYTSIGTEWDGIIVSIAPIFLPSSPGGGVAYTGGGSFAF